MTIEAKGSEPRLTTPGDSVFMLAYRCWHAGFDYGDAECWQYAWTALSNALGPDEARPVLGAIEDFVRSLRAVARRRLDYYPPPCCRMSDSEQRVVELIAALQAGTPGEEELIASLCGAVSEDASRLVLAHGRALASRLLDVGIVLAQRRPPGPGRRSDPCTSKTLMWRRLSDSLGLSATDAFPAGTDACNQSREGHIGAIECSFDGNSPLTMEPRSAYDCLLL